MNFKDYFNKGYKYDLKNEIIKIKSTGRQISEIDLYKKWKSECDIEPEEFISQKESEDVILEIIEEQLEHRDSRESNQSMPRFNSIEEFISYALELKNIGIESNGSRFFNKSVCNKDGTRFDDIDVRAVVLAVTSVNYMNDDMAARDDKDNKRMTFAKQRIEDTLESMLDEMYTDSRVAMQQQLAYDPIFEMYTDSALSKICELYEFKEGVPFSKSVLKHFIWQVKRFFYIHDVKSPYLVNILGKSQEIGKSKLIEILSSPLKDYSIPINIDSLLETHSGNIMSKYYITLLDELELPSDPSNPEYAKTVSKIKQLLTTKEIGGRNMYSERIKKNRRTYSAIASTNFSILKMLSNDTGFRRFIELETMLTSSDGKKIRDIVGTVMSFDMVKIWRGVNEDCDEGILHVNSEHYETLQKMQSPKNRIDYFAEFIDYYCENNNGRFVKEDDLALCSESEEVDIVDLCEAHLLFMRGMVSHQYKKMTLSNFMSALESKDIHLFQTGRRLTSSKCYFYKDFSTTKGDSK